MHEALCLLFKCQKCVSVPVIFCNLGGLTAAVTHAICEKKKHSLQLNFRTSNELKHITH